MSRSMFLNTRDSLNATTPHNTSWIIPSLDLSNISAYGMRVQSITLSNSVYAINNNYNKMSFNEDNGAGTNDDYTITLTNQDYTGTQLATEIASQMTTASSANLGFTYSGSYNSQTKYITITLTDGLPNTFKFQTSSLANNCYREAGFTSSDIDNQTLAVSQTSNSFIDLSGTRYVDIISNSLNTSNISSSTTSNVLARVPLTSDIGSVIYFENESPLFRTLRNDQLEQIDIQIRDDRSNEWVLDDNHPVSLVVQFKIQS